MRGIGMPVRTRAIPRIAHGPQGMQCGHTPWAPIQHGDNFALSRQRLECRATIVGRHCFPRTVEPPQFDHGPEAPGAAWPPAMLRQMPDPFILLDTSVLFAASTTPDPTEVAFPNFSHSRQYSAGIVFFVSSDALKFSNWRKSS